MMELRKLNQDYTMTANLVLTREFRLRMWLAVRLIWLAAWVLDCDVEVNALEPGRAEGPLGAGA